MSDDAHDTLDVYPEDEAVRVRVQSLEITLASIWENDCEDCGRPFHPRSTVCYGCQLDKELAARGIPL